ncbi:hypothetical protein ACJ3XI_11305 [Litorimonas sp. RW-G-Af-16]|uniref:RipA family octameric membrane protein n=1 Tax=Litorimonas sp. RW-G-Af-16 TaxID=3241168 RepID=UPI00390C9D16
MGWFLVNRGSKFWQENWENHVDNLEDDVIGPLYKVILSRPNPTGLDEKTKHVLTGSSTISVSKVNQIISLYVTLLWGILIVHSLLPISPKLGLDPIKIAILMMTFLTVGAFFRYGWSHAAPMRQVIKKRDVDFHAKENEPKPSL